jgi:hypothetical protein
MIFKGLNRLEGRVAHRQQVTVDASGHSNHLERGYSRYVTSSPW